MATRFRRWRALGWWGAGLMAAAVLAALAAPAAGDTGAVSPEVSAPFSVVLRDQAPYFSPRRLRVPPGGRVVWRNEGPALVHTIVMATASGTVRSGSILPGQSWEHTFTRDDDAIVKAACEVHPYMYGVVVVGDPPDSLIEAVEKAAVTSGSTPHAPLPGRILEFPLPLPDSVPDILAVDAEDNVWFTMGGGGVKSIDLPPLHFVGRLTLDGDVRVFTLPTAASVPNGLAVDTDGTVFVSQFLGNKLSRLDPRRQTLEEYELPTPGGKPTGIAIDPQGGLWFSETGADKIGHLDAAGTITEYPVPTAGAHPTAILVDPAGDVWFSERDAGKIGRLRRDGSFVEYALPSPKSKPAGMALDSRGRVWFAEMRGDRIGVIDGGVVREYPLPNPGSGPFFLVIDDEDGIWFTQTFGDRIGYLDPETGAVSEIELPTRGGWPSGLAMDSQGNLWFAMQLKNKIGVLLRSPDEVPSPHVMAAAGTAAGSRDGGPRSLAVPAEDR